MTNPDNIVRVRARNGGRASVYEANGWAQAYTSGLLEGNGVTQNTSADMNVLVGGSTTKPDVVLAENAAGYRIALDIVGQQAIAITAPASNSRITAIVAYTDDLSLATTEDTVTGSPASCGLLAVNGTTSASPSDPTDTQIRNAITADGATGSQAAYCVIATILVANDTTTITDSLITMNTAQIGAYNIDFTTIRVPTPDYANAQSFSTNTYTATADGFIRARCDISTQGNKESVIMSISITRNGVTYAIVSEGNYFDITGYNHAYIDKTFPVRAGDTVDLSLTGSSASWSTRDFYPVLW